MMILFCGFLLGSVILLLYSFKPLIMSVMLLGVAFFSFLMFLFLNLYWFSVMFFLIYIGGVLVLFFYMFSLSPKPFTFVGGGGLGGFMFFFGVILCSSYSFYSFPLGSSYFGVLLLSEKDVWLVVFLTCLLLNILWLMSKILFNVSGSARVLM